jgi:hypothetical protein
MLSPPREKHSIEDRQNREQGPLSIKDKNRQFLVIIQNIHLKIGI